MSKATSRRVLLTGASRGIGRAICLRLAAEGATIAACGSAHGDELAAVVEEAGRAGGRVVPLLGDLSDPATPARLVAEAEAALGGLDAVVGNAGVSRPSTLAEMELADWEFLFGVNLRAPWLLAKAAYPALRESRGSFVSVASMSGVQPYPGMGAYSPSKAGLLMLIRVLAQEWAADGVRVNAVSPGLIHTPLTARVYADPAVRAGREALIPLHRIGDPAEHIAGVVAFLLSDAATYMTGQNLLADGGLLDAVQGLIPGRPATER
ncbi:SDR family oxidoreductase [Aromatoleum toluolicum]|uniref:SDR family oxidoreductase n=1 Tax=Aromatoleum toluolicum TaxID=90060 RepID=A0ABX1NAL3_9RHOO|nr:SDR family NAD(P)-dependent oxidoreductase [Aromatoleum toluolicum]NMF96330.1 SDR family oxidoreductase [Aromatoleum toluolicum]